MIFLWKGKGIAIKVLVGPKEVYFGGGLAQIGWAMFGGKRFLFQDRTPERVDYIGRPALVMIVAFYKFGCIL